MAREDVTRVTRSRYGLNRPQKTEDCTANKIRNAESQSAGLLWAAACRVRVKPTARTRS